MVGMFSQEESRLAVLRQCQKSLETSGPWLKSLEQVCCGNHQSGKGCDTQERRSRIDKARAEPDWKPPRQKCARLSVRWDQAQRDDQADDWDEHDGGKLGNQGRAERNAGR